jgi:lysophospholipase L1-like esterase
LRHYIYFCYLTGPFTGPRHQEAIVKYLSVELYTADGSFSSLAWIPRLEGVEIAGLGIRQQYLASRRHTKNELCDDGLHVNAKGYAVMSPLAEQAIRLALKAGK